MIKFESIGPYGESIESAPDDVGYTGHKFDKNLGLSFIQACYYDPFIGRFYSDDPVDVLGHRERGNSIAHGFGRYTYVNNNPYKYVDTNGEFGVQIAAILIGSVIGGATEVLTNDNASFSSVARASAVGGAVGLASSLGGGIISSALLGGGANAAGEAANQIATGDINASKVATAGVTGVIGGALAKGVANTVQGALKKGLPDNSISQAIHNTTQSKSQRILSNSQSLNNIGSQTAVAETQVGAGFAVGSAIGMALADKVCEQSSGC